eukprot:SAG22_NODE_2070_length_3052_cov_1.855401_4_plen_97_part_00
MRSGPAASGCGWISAASGCGWISALMLYSLTQDFEQPLKLSPLYALLHAAGSTGWTELLVLVPMLYYVYCCIFTLFRIKIFSFIEIFPGSTDGAIY